MIIIHVRPAGPGCVQSSWYLPAPSGGTLRLEKAIPARSCIKRGGKSPRRSLRGDAFKATKEAVGARGAACSTAQAVSQGPRHLGGCEDAVSDARDCTEGERACTF